MLLKAEYLKSGMLLWLKETKPYTYMHKYYDSDGNVLYEEERTKSNRRMEVEVVGTHEDYGSTCVIYHAKGDLGKWTYDRPISDFEWHDNGRVCFSCKRKLEQTTTRGFCTVCKGIKCHYDGKCLCDHPEWGEKYRGRVIR